MKIICKKCGGEGRVPDMAERIFTLGISWVFEKLTQDHRGYVKCPKCNGKGTIKTN